MKSGLVGGVEGDSGLELSPHWKSMHPLFLKGEVQVRINGDTITVPATFSRAGASPTDFEGNLRIEVSSGGMSLEGLIPVMYGVKGPALKKQSGALGSSPWIAEDCDAVFVQAGQRPWSEVFHGSGGIPNPPGEQSSTGPSGPPPGPPPN